MINSVNDIGNLCSWIGKNTAGSSSVLELGAGFFENLRLCVKSPKKIGIEIWPSYVESSSCGECETILGDALKYRDYVKKEDMDCVLIFDVLEHFEKDVALKLIDDLQNDFNKIVLMIPEGNHPQVTDVTGHGAHETQTHRSTWQGKDIEDMGFQHIDLVKDFHSDPNKDRGCLFAIWNRV